MSLAVRNIQRKKEAATNENKLPTNPIKKIKIGVELQNKSSFPISKPSKMNNCQVQFQLANLVTS